MSDFPTAPPPGGSAVQPMGSPAGLGPRFIARLIDWGISAALRLPGIVLLFAGSAIGGGAGTAILLLGVLLYLAAMAAYFYIFAWGQGETGQTPGKRSQGIALVDSASGLPIGGGKGVARVFLESILNTFCWISLIVGVFGARNQMLHDKVLTAEVVERGLPGNIMPIFPNGTPF